MNLVPARRDEYLPAKRGADGHVIEFVKPEKEKIVITIPRTSSRQDNLVNHGTEYYKVHCGKQEVDSNLFNIQTPEEIIEMFSSGEIKHVSYVKGKFYVKDALFTAGKTFQFKRNGLGNPESLAYLRDSLQEYGFSFVEGETLTNFMKSQGISPEVFKDQVVGMTSNSKNEPVLFYIAKSDLPSFKKQFTHDTPVDSTTEDVNLHKPVIELKARSGEEDVTDKLSSTHTNIIEITRAVSHPVQPVVKEKVHPIKNVPENAASKIVKSVLIQLHADLIAMNNLNEDMKIYLQATEKVPYKKVFGSFIFKAARLHANNPAKTAEITERTKDAYELLMRRLFIKLPKKILDKTIEDQWEGVEHLIHEVSAKLSPESRKAEITHIEEIRNKKSKKESIAIHDAPTQKNLPVEKAKIIPFKPKVQNIPAGISVGTAKFSEKIIPIERKRSEKEQTSLKKIFSKGITQLKKWWNRDTF